MFDTMRFWLDMGVDGFRLDAIPYLVERDGTNNENLPETHAVIKKLRAAHRRALQEPLAARRGQQWPEDVREYFGDGDECHMAYHFPLMPRMYMAIAQEDRYPIVEIMQQTPEIPDNCQWAIFLRNHDELTLEMVTSKERDYMYSMYAADPRARINLGIRRRLAPLMENDIDRIKLMNSLLLSMPGSPIIYYGDEIGMGDNIFLGDRNGVRTPMQWSPDRNAGFSRADPQRLYLPPIMDPMYGYEAVNVEAQARDAVLAAQLDAAHARRAQDEPRASAAARCTLPASPATARCSPTCASTATRRSCAWPTCRARRSRSSSTCRRFKGRVPVEMLGRTPFPPIGELPYLLTLPAHGFYWFRLAADAECPSWHAGAAARCEDLPVLVLFDGWTSFFRDRVVPWRIGMAERMRAQLETEMLPRFIETQRWYARQGRSRSSARALVDHARAGRRPTAQLAARRCSSSTARPEPSTLLPAAGARLGGAATRSACARLAPAARGQGAPAGQRRRAWPTRSPTRPSAARWSRRSARGARARRPRSGALRFRPTEALRAARRARRRRAAGAPARRTSSNTIVTLGERLFLKGYRRLRAGINPELEIGRFLTEVAHFPHCVPVAGALEYVGRRRHAR